MQITPPIVSANAPYAGAVQPAARNSAQVAISVAIVIPEMGLDEVPIRPTMRDDTVTKRKPKTTTSTDAITLARKPVGAPGTGLNVSSPHIISTTSAEPASTTVVLRSRAVRPAASGEAPSLSFLRSAAPALRAATIVGTVFSSVIRPAAATAPAPM